MKSLVLSAAAAGALIALTACSPNTATSTASPTPKITASATHSVNPATCRQQYSAWKSGPADTIVAELSAVDTA